MSLELTENTSNIGSGALYDLVFILYCRVIRQWLPTNRQSVGDQLGSDRQPIDGWRLYLGRLFLIADSLQLFLDRLVTDRRLVGDQSASKNCVGIVYNRCNWSAISRQPVGDQSATPNNLSTIDLVAERFYLQQPKPPCDQIVPETICNRFGRKEVADRLQAMCDRGLSMTRTQKGNETSIECISRNTFAHSSI